MGELNAVRQREQQDAVASKEREMEKALQEKAALQAELETIRTTQESQVWPDVSMAGSCFCVRSLYSKASLDLVAFDDAVAFFLILFRPYPLLRRASRKISRRE